MSTSQKNNQKANLKDKANTKNKTLHSRNLHKHGYNFSALIETYPSLSPYVSTNRYDNLSIDFANPIAVKKLNTALLKQYYNIVEWDIPTGALCPPIPGRADYIHYIAQLLETSGNANTSSTSSAINMLDIGTGANGIYPLLACQIYGWHCVGSDINAQSLDNVAAIIARNPDLKGRFLLRKQNDSNSIFKGIIKADEFYDVTVCNPPFHASQQDAIKGSQRKLSNLARNRAEKTLTLSAEGTTPTLNFSGQDAELWCNGGERLFLKKMIKESQLFSTQCRWFTSLVSKQENVKPAIKLIKKLGATQVKKIQMVQGNKITRILAWTYL
ncbi:MAG: 23S rRNA (adenine(1618)-N(6))-methyltransferase RlmF [Colwellia sp.]